jgi:hypothetical protein
VVLMASGRVAAWLKASAAAKILMRTVFIAADDRIVAPGVSLQAQRYKKAVLRRRFRRLTQLTAF